MKVINFSEQNTVINQYMALLRDKAYQRGRMVFRHNIERIGTMMYNVARVFGYRVDTFTRDYRVSYGERPDGTLYPAEVRYKMYYAGRDGDSTKEEAEFSQQTGGGFPNMEATMTLSPTTHHLSPITQIWHQLPPSWYVTFNSEADRQLEVQLSNLPATFSIFDEQP